MSAPAPRLIVTSGDPAGIGPDLCIILAQRPHPADLVVASAPEVLADRAASLGLSLEQEPFEPSAPATGHTGGRVKVLSIPMHAPVRPGRLDPANAPYVLGMLRAAVLGCLDGTFDAMVTAPIHKGVINDAGIPFTGHTEYIATLCGDPLPVMLLTAPGLRVGLLTTHLPLREVADAVTGERLTRVVRILDRDLRSRFSITSPRILVCGLNPHAGEGGHMGREEIEIMVPALKRLREEGLDVEGPLPADTIFTRSHLDRADAVLAMYHDQGLPVLKHLGFGNAVNITLGLPLIRTSVDHGTALDLAGTGQVDVGSLAAAVRTAMEMVGSTRGGCGA